MKKYFKNKKKYNLRFFGLIFIIILLFGNISIWLRIFLGNRNNIQRQEAKTTNQIASTDNSYGELVITEDDPSMGSREAKVTIVIFSDFLCPYCAAYSGESKKMVDSMKKIDSLWQPALPNIITDYVKNDKVKIVWKDLPYHGEEALSAHAAARCANDQNKFWEYHNLLFAQNDSNNNEPFSKDNLKKLASKLDLIINEFNECLDGGKYDKMMQEAISYGKSTGINSTPTTYVNGKLIIGAAPYSQFKLLIEEELTK